MDVTPNISAVFTLVNARRHLSLCCYADNSYLPLTTALWALVWELSGDELEAALLIVKLDTARDCARYA